MPDFEELSRRLIQRLRFQISCGDWTERSLARRAGVSQPHLHNVLKGERTLSMTMADRLVRASSLSVLDLLDVHEALDAQQRAILRDAGAPALPGTRPLPGGPFRPS